MGRAAPIWFICREHGMSGVRLLERLFRELISACGKYVVRSALEILLKQLSLWFRAMCAPS